MKLLSYTPPVAEIFLVRVEGTFMSPQANDNKVPDGTEDDWGQF